MKGRKFVSLDPDKIKDEYPKFFDNLKKWLKGDELQGESDLLLDNSIKSILVYSPRMLYDYLDDNGLYLQITKVPEDKDHWIHLYLGDAHSLVASSRMLAEEAGFMIGIGLIEERLKANKDGNKAVDG